MQNKELTEKLKRLPGHQHEVAAFVDSYCRARLERRNAARDLRETGGMWEGEAEGIAHENACANNGAATLEWAGSQTPTCLIDHLRGIPKAT